MENVKEKPKIMESVKDLIHRSDMQTHKILFGKRRTADMPSVEGVDDDVPRKGYGVYGESHSGGFAVYGVSDNQNAVVGKSLHATGVHGEAGRPRRCFWPKRQWQWCVWPKRQGQWCVWPK